MAKPPGAASAAKPVVTSRHREARRPSHTLRIAAAAGALIVALCLPVATATATPTAIQSSLPVAVSIDRLDPGTPVPAEFLGLSFEATALEQIAQYAHRGDLVTLLRSLGPGVLRFGGITADQNVAWTDAATPRPPWASHAIDAAQLHSIGVLARRSGWTVLLTVGLAHYEPAAAAREVAAAHRALGANLAAVEIGNEPDAYGRHGFRPLPWLAQGYEEEVSDYREAIQALTPGVPIAGPDVSGSGMFIEWGEEEALSQRPALLTGHHYPLGCAQKPPPTIESLLSVVTRGRESASLETYLKVARNQHVPAAHRRGELGLLRRRRRYQQHVRLGALGDRLHHAGDGRGSHRHQPAGQPRQLRRLHAAVRARPERAGEGRLRAQPDWYALLLTSSLVGYRPLPTTVTGEGEPNLVVASFSGPAPFAAGRARRRRTAGLAPAGADAERRRGHGPRTGSAPDRTRPERHRRHPPRRPRGRGRRLAARAHPP